MNAEKCNECGEPADKHDEKCWLGPRERRVDDAWECTLVGYRSRFRDRDGVLRDLTPEELIADCSFPGYALLPGPPLTTERIEAAAADAERGWDDEHVPEPLRERYRKVFAVCGRNSAENWLSFRIGEQ